MDKVRAEIIKELQPFAPRSLWPSKLDIYIMEVDICCGNREHQPPMFAFSTIMQQFVQPDASKQIGSCYIIYDQKTPR